MRVRRDFLDKHRKSNTMGAYETAELTKAINDLAERVSALESTNKKAPAKKKPAAKAAPKVTTTGVV